MDVIRPREHLITAGKQYPNAWKQAERFRSIRGKDVPDWPEWCYLPMSGWYAIISADSGKSKLTPALAGDVGRLAALGSWRMTQSIYRFDPTLYDEIRSTPVTGDLPCAVLYHLPEWCIYIETPWQKIESSAIHGVFAHLEYDSNDHRHELRLLIDAEDALIPVPIHIGDWSLDEALQRMATEAVRQGFPDKGLGECLPELRKTVEQILSLILYICSEAAELGDGSRKPGKPRPVKTKAGLRIFAPEKPLIWEVGSRLGAALRHAYQETEQTAQQSDRSRPRPHIRRAHWHTYLYGPMRDQPKLKWLPPIPVNVDDFDKLPSVIKKIE